MKIKIDTTKTKAENIAAHMKEYERTVLASDESSETKQWLLNQRKSEISYQYNQVMNPSLEKKAKEEGWESAGWKSFVQRGGRGNAPWL